MPRAKSEKAEKPAKKAAKAAADGEVRETRQTILAELAERGYEGPTSFAVAELKTILADVRKGKKGPERKKPGRKPAAANA